MHPETAETEASAMEQRILASLENLVFALGEAAGADRSSLFLVDEAHAELRLAVARSEDGRPLAVRMPLGCGVVGMAWERGTPIRVDDAYACERFNPEVDAISGYRTRSLLCVPVRDAAGRVAAIVELLNPAGRSAFSDEDAQALAEHEPEISALVGAWGALH